MVNISGLSKAAALAALYNASKPQGMGLLQFTPQPMTIEEAQALLDTPGERNGHYFDYLKGRVMKVLVPTDGDEIDERLYDRDNGAGAAERAIAAIRPTGLEVTNLE